MEANIIKLDQNENPWGCSAKAINAINNISLRTHIYPNFFPEELVNKLSLKFNLEPDNVVVGAGSVEIVDIIIKSLVAYGETIITPELSFTAYKILAEIHGRNYKLSKMKNFGIDLDHILDQIDDKTKVIFIVNPNNPTGTIITHEELLSFLKKVPDDICIAIDEAYVEYATDLDFPKSLSLMDEFDNIILLRTFSKVYGLAGLRIGYGLSKNKDTIQKLRNSKLHFSINSFAQAAAIAALDDDGFVENSVSTNAEQRDYLIRELSNLNYNVIPSQANFLYLSFENEKDKADTLMLLTKNGIIARPCDMFGDSKAFRITVGKPEDNRKVIEILKE